SLQASANLLLDFNCSQASFRGVPMLSKSGSLLQRVDSGEERHCLVDIRRAYRCERLPLNPAQEDKAVVTVDRNHAGHRTKLVAFHQSQGIDLGGEAIVQIVLLRRV